MTARKADLTMLPTWPRLLSREQAAAYCGLSPNTFTAHVKVEPMRLGGRKLFDRKSLDAWLDKMGGGVNPSAQEWLDKFDADQAQRRSAG